MSPEVARRVVQLFQKLHPPESADYHLSPTEMRVLRLLAEGHHYKTAPAEMQISINTVSYHMRSIYQKLQVHSKSEGGSQGVARSADSISSRTPRHHLNRRYLSTGTSGIFL
jgi:DNA-binding NarL/FixJ family response regulator